MIDSSSHFLGGLGLLLLALGGTPAIAETSLPEMGDTRGPVVSLRNAAMTVVATPSGVEAPGYRYLPPPDMTGPGQVKWIGPANGPGAAILLRKEVTLNQMPRHVQVWVTAGTKFRLYINGTLADRGPADQGRDFQGGSTHRWFYDSRDLTHLFHAGKNVVAAAVLGGAPFLFQAQAEMPGGRALTLTSDDTWRGTHTDYLPDGGNGFDGTKEPIGWQTAGFDDSGWAACQVRPGVTDTLTASSLTLTASVLPPCMEAPFPMLGIDRVTGGVQVPAQPFTDGHPIVVTGDGSFAVRFPRVMSAYMGIKVKGGAGAQITLEPHEVNTPGSNNDVSHLALRDGVQYFETTGFASVGVINVTVSHVTTPVEIMEVISDSTSQPVAYNGAFECSDPALNTLWKSCRWSTQICMQTWHLDSPLHQEPICDYGDYLIADRVAFNAFGDNPAIAKQDLYKWAWVMKDLDYHTFHTSYALLWLQSLIQYYNHTGDAATVKALSPYVYELLDRFAGYRGKNGLISEAPNYMFMDWVNIEGFTAHHPPAVIGQGYMTAFYSRALEDAAQVANMTGDSARAEGYMQIHAEVTAAYNRELWDPEKGLYRDGKPFQTTVPPGQWLPADKDIQTWSAQNNVLAVLYDLAPKDRQKTVIDNTMAQTPWNVRPYYMQFVLDAVAHAGLFDKYGTKWMRKWQLNPETQTAQEMGDQGDWSHGWIATPLNQMSERILGITPTSPAYQTIAIRPTLCDLQWAKGRVPAPQGLIAVSWNRQGGGLTLSVMIPPGTVAAVAIPAVSAGARITANGKGLWAAGHGAAGVSGLSRIHQTAFAIEMQAAPGTYTFVGQRLGLTALPVP